MVGVRIRIDDINATYIAYSDGISSLTDGN